MSSAPLSTVCNSREDLTNGNTIATPSTQNLRRQLFAGRTPGAEEVFTPEDFSEQQQMIGRTAEEFAVNEILPNVEKMEHKDFSISRDLLKKAGELGLSGVEIPEAYGGLEMDKVTAAVIADNIAKYAGFSTTWGAHSGIGLLPIVYSGPKSRRKNTCRGWRRVSSSALMRYRKHPPDRMP